ncbi:hypothetical protein QPK32_05510 [Massilia sp. YIM B02763]|uniref:DUF6941 family protein n=1 Tax=Massilia sp. YIM B02763 TaxID=3050130 RepID=UPI0025B664EF|nr:hypothetical protein [Massilia sp. YIM B02763]MDN4052523.1 hypothetical protein [Massilia sp. YIM B02763]
MIKLNSPYIHAIFCDDVRTEIGGKLSLMGIYQGSLQISAAAFPVVIPKICAVVEARTPATSPLEKLHIKVLLDETILAEEDFSSDQLASLKSDDTSQYATAGIIFSIQPFVVSKSGILRVRAETADGEIGVGGIKVNLSSTENPLIAVV